MLILLIIGVVTFVMGVPLTYRGFQKRGVVPGVSPYERLRASLSVPELVIGVLLGLLGAVLLGVYGGVAG